MRTSSSNLFNMTLRPSFCYHVLVSCISHGSFLCYDITFEGYKSDTIPLHSMKHQFIRPTHRNIDMTLQTPEQIIHRTHCLWKVTRIGFPASPMAIPAVASLALIAPDSFSYSTKAMPFRPGTVLTSRNPSKRLNTADRFSWSAVSGSSRRKRILFGGRYSSGMTAAAAPAVGLRPAPLAVFAGRAPSATPAGRLSFFWASRASWACLRSVVVNQIQCYIKKKSSKSATWKKNVPFSANRLLLCTSNSSDPPSRSTVASLLVFA